MDLKPENMTERERKAYLTKFLESKRGRRAYRPAPHASYWTGKALRPLSKKFGAGTAGLSANWGDIVGTRYARLSKPARLIGSKDGTTLLIIARGPAATLLSANSNAILSKVNQFLGKDNKLGQTISRLKITQGEINLDTQAQAGLSKARPAPRRPKRGLTHSETEKLKSGLESVKNDKLKHALEKLGRGVIGRQN